MLKTFVTQQTKKGSGTDKLNLSATFFSFNCRKITSKMTLSIRRPIKVKSLFHLLLLLVFIVISCKKNNNPAPALSSKKEITLFVIANIDNPDIVDSSIVATISNDTIFIDLKESIPVTSLRPKISFVGKNISPASLQPVDLTNPVRYTIIADDGSSNTYTAIVHRLSALKQITGFSFLKNSNPSLTADITGSIKGDTIVLSIPSDFNTKTIVPEIIFDGKTITPNNRKANDFSYPTDYTVTAEDRTTHTYHVIATCNKMVYYGSTDGFLYALDAVFGTVKWKYKIGSRVSNPVYSDGMVYAGGYNNSFYALDAVTGQLKWVNKNGSCDYSGTSVVGEKIFISYQSNSTYTTNYYRAINRITGTTLWTVNLVNGGYGLPSSPTAVNGIVYVSEVNIGMIALDAATGATKWVYKGMIVSKPIIENGVVYFDAENSAATAVDAATGKLIWSNMEMHGAFAGMISKKGDIIYSSGRSTKEAGYFLFAFNAADGVLKWKYTIDINGGKFSSPWVYDSVVYVGNENRLLYAINAIDGSLKWYSNNPDSYNSTLPSPIVNGGFIFYSWQGGDFYCINAKNGKPFWIIKSPALITTDPCVVDNNGNAYYPGHYGK